MGRVDPPSQVASELLDCLVGLLDDEGRPVCRAVLASGGSVPWDVCGESSDGSEGQAWVAVGQVTPVEQFPAGSPPHRCPPPEYATVLTVAVLRCAATVDDQGRPPSPERMAADASKVAADRAAMRDAVVCCLAGGLEPGEWQMGSWTPLGPQGGCVGGQQQVTVATRACRCVEVGDG